MPFLHDDRGRVPTQDVRCRVDTCAVFVAAMATAKAGLALAALSVNGSTVRAGLRGVMGRLLH